MKKSKNHLFSVPKKNAKRISAITTSIFFGIFTLVSFQHTSNVYAATNTATFTFTEGTSDPTKEVINLPANFDSIKKITTDNGEIDYDEDRSEVTITLSDGDYTSRDSFYNPTLKSKDVLKDDYLDTNSFPTTKDYSDDEGYSGILTATGDTYVVSGDLIPGDTKTVTKSQTVSNLSYLPESLSYNKNGFKGVLTKSGSYITGPDGEYIQYYSGNVSSDSKDTRNWRQNYSGEVYKGGTDYKNYKYTYNITVTYNESSINIDSCSYKGISPSTNTVVNYKPKCVKLGNNSTNLYEMSYSYTVTGISNAGDKK